MSKSIPGKLSSAAVAEIQKKYAGGGYSYRDLGVEYNVSHRTIWFHVTKNAAVA
jgi:hypothetical protein